jgi:hypothetical protein
VTLSQRRHRADVDRAYLPGDLPRLQRELEVAWGRHARMVDRYEAVRRASPTRARTAAAKVREALAEVDRLTAAVQALGGES